jgi:hypothetical protein
VLQLGVALPPAPLMASTRCARLKESVAEPAVDEADTTAYVPVIQVPDHTIPPLVLAVLKHHPRKCAGASPSILLVKMTAT